MNNRKSSPRACTTDKLPEMALSAAQYKRFNQGKEIRLTCPEGKPLGIVSEDTVTRSLEELKRLDNLDESIALLSLLENFSCNQSSLELDSYGIDGLSHVLRLAIKALMPVEHVPLQRDFDRKH